MQEIPGLWLTRRTLRRLTQGCESLRQRLPTRETAWRDKSRPYAMHCPFCQHEDTRVIDSREAEDGATIRRRRECEHCGERFNTFETVEIKLPAIVKSDGRREAFDDRKLRVGIERALQKRPVASDAVDNVVREVVRQLRAINEREVPSRQIGEWVMTELKRLDQVAYVRFASVYRRFEDVQAFREEIEKLEKDLPELEGLQLPLLGEVRKKKGSESFFELSAPKTRNKPEK